MSEPKDDGFHRQVTLPILAVLFVTALMMAVSWSSSVYAERRGQQIATARFQKEAIEKGFAKYDGVNGEWRWKEAGELTLISIIESGGESINQPDEDDGPEFPLSQPPKKRDQKSKNR